MKIQRKFGFEQGRNYLATVKSIKKDKVTFTMTLDNENKFDAVYYIHGEHINPFTAFKVGNEEIITLLHFNKDTRLFGGVSIEVAPLFLPIDIYVQENPPGSVITGTVEKIMGNFILIRFTENVSAHIKRFKNAQIGTSVSCLLKRFNHKKRQMSLLLVK